MEIRTDLLAAAVRHAEAAEKYTGTTRKALERIAADYFRRAVGVRWNAPATHNGATF